jgi:hypothetical protein
MLSELARNEVIRYSVDGGFKRAALFFSDNSFLEFQHAGRDNRWARPSGDGTVADKICQSLQQFRLNAKHLQLFFSDGSNVEFFTNDKQH